MAKELKRHSAIGYGEVINFFFYIKLHKKTAIAIFLHCNGIKQYIPVNLSTKLMTFFIQIGINSIQLLPFVLNIEGSGINLFIAAVLVFLWNFPF